MGQRGPAPKPTRLRIIEGNRSKRPLPKDEPQPQVGRPQYPRWLISEARSEWKRIVPELMRLGLLTLIDRAALAGYCQAYARWQQAERILTKEGLTFVGDNGDIKQRPEVAIAQKSLQQVKAFCQEFGLTPASRTRISAPKQPEKEDPMGRFID